MLSWLGTWKIKLAIIAFVVLGAFAWHKHTVSSEVSKAVATTEANIQLQYSKERFRLIEKSNEATFALKDELSNIKKDKDAQLKTTTDKYNNLLAWLSTQPRSTASSGSVSPDATYGESTERITGTGLSERDADALAEHATATNRLKDHLLACYRQHDTELAAQERFLRDASGSLQNTK